MQHELSDGVQASNGKSGLHSLKKVSPLIHYVHLEIFNIYTNIEYIHAT